MSRRRTFIWTRTRFVVVVVTVGIMCFYAGVVAGFLLREFATGGGAL